MQSDVVFGWFWIHEQVTLTYELTCWVCDNGGNVVLADAQLDIIPDGGIVDDSDVLVFVSRRESPVSRLHSGPYEFKAAHWQCHYGVRLSDCMIIHKRLSSHYWDCEILDLEKRAGDGIIYVFCDHSVVHPIDLVNVFTF